jgi:hypothetical protein
MSDKKSYKRPVAVKHTVTTAEAAATQLDLDMLSGVSTNQVTGDMTFFFSCRSAADGTEKAGGLKAVYSQSGSLAGSVRIANGVSTLVANDVVDVIGMFNSIE